MGSSLRDQLLKAGLVDEKRAKKAERDKRKAAKEAKKARKAGRATGPDPAEVAAERARQERKMYAERSKELNRAREEERARKAVEAEVRGLLKKEAEAHGKGDVRYNFVHGTKIKRLYVTRGQRDALAGGKKGIVGLNGRYHLVAAELAEKVRERLPDAFVHVAEPEVIDPDDPYAAYPIPDDLEW